MDQVYTDKVAEQKVEGSQRIEPNRYDLNAMCFTISSPGISNTILNLLENTPNIVKVAKDNNITI